MKRFALATLAAFALLVPTVAAAQGVQFVYRPELRGLVPAPRPQVESSAPVVARSAEEQIARHQAMALTFRGARHAQAAAHCDRLIAEARKQF
jgi:hypothetical protein